MQNGIYKRTFEAMQYENGGITRGELNLNPLTSAYYPEHKYLLCWDKVITYFRTEEEAKKYLSLKQQNV